MNRRDFLLGSLAVAGATAAGGLLGFTRLRGGGSSGEHEAAVRRYGDVVLRQGTPASDAPNVLMLALDDCNDWLGFLNDHPGTYTPNLDALAAQSVVFTKAYAPAPMCLPARTAILFGRPPFETGIYDHSDASFENYGSLAQVTPSVVDDFWAAGYEMIGAGKIFHHYDATRWTRYRETKHYVGGVHRQEPIFAGRYDPDWRSPYDGRPIGRGERFAANMIDFGPSGQTPGREPDGEASTWIRRQLRKRHNRPLFVALGFFLPHEPWRVPKRYFNLHPLERIVVPEFRPDDLDDLGAYARNEIIDVQGGIRGIFELLRQSGLWEEAVQAYQAAISFVDDRVGQVLNELADSPLADETIIVVWSDHGYHLGEKLHIEKFTLWERATRVPLLLHVPRRFDHYAAFERPVSTIDLGPTLTDLCRVEAHTPYGGGSLLPLLADPALADDRTAITTWLEGNHAVRRGPWRYIRYRTGERELYDQRTDPNEYVNLAGRAEYAAVEAELAAFLPAR